MVPGKGSRHLGVDVALWKKHDDGHVGKPAPPADECGAQVSPQAKVGERSGIRDRARGHPLAFGGTPGGHPRRHGGVPP
eukprot:223857-Pyramimonas_sp.AAC.1